MTESSIPRPPRQRRLKAAGIGFIPVRARARRDGWTPERQQRFLAALYACGIVATAASAVGMTVQSAYRLRRRPGGESFAAAWDKLLRKARSRAFDQAMAKALGQSFVPRTYRGLFTGLTTENNDAMVLAALRASGAAERIARSARDPARNALFPSGKGYE